LILVTRLNGSVFALNPDLIQRVDSTPDTVVTLVDGAKFVITESLTETVELALGFRARVVATAHALEESITAGSVGVPAHLTDVNAATGATHHEHGRTTDPTNDDDSVLPAPVPLHRRRP
jgi:flagellar protein FlbD